MGIYPKIKNEIFRFIKNSVNSLLSGIRLEKRSIYIVQLGSESTIYLGAEIWDSILEDPTSESVDIFKSKI